MSSSAIVAHQPIINLDILKVDPSAIGKKIYEILPEFRRTLIESAVSLQLKIQRKFQPGAEVNSKMVQEAIHNQLGSTAKARLVLEHLLHTHLPESSVYQEYLKLGSALPGGDLLKETKKALSRVFHEDRNIGNPELIKKYEGVMAQAQQSITYLGKSEHCALYNQIAPMVEKLSGKGKITDIFDGILGRQKAGATAANEGAFAKIAKRIREAKPENKLAMLAGASVVLGALVAYGMSKINKDKKEESPGQGFADKEEARRVSQISGNISAQAVA
jgi:hypothetical protein